MKEDNGTPKVVRRARRKIFEIEERLRANLAEEKMRNLMEKSFSPEEGPTKSQTNQKTEMANTHKKDHDKSKAEEEAKGDQKIEQDRLAKISELKDRWKALLHGPTFINGHFLALNFWKQGFSAASTENFTFTPVWIKLEGLPIEYFDPNILIRVGNSIGKFIGIDGHTHNLSIAKHARICVLLDLPKVPPNLITIGKFNQTLIFEDISNICISCRGANHAQYACKGKKPLLPSPQSQIELTRKEEQWQVVIRRKYHQKSAKTPSIMVKGKGGGGGGGSHSFSNSKKSSDIISVNPQGQEAHPVKAFSLSEKDKNIAGINKEKPFLYPLESRDSFPPLATTLKSATSPNCQGHKSTCQSALSPKNKQKRCTLLPKENIDNLSPLRRKSKLEVENGATTKDPFCKPLQDPHNHSSKGFLPESSNGTTSDHHQSPKSQHSGSLSLKIMGEPHINSHSSNYLASSLGEAHARKPTVASQGACCEGADDKPPRQWASSPIPSGHHSNQSPPCRPPDEQRTFQHYERMNIFN
ncbi:uncharacterized protein G2W53_022457 [Senna tora]|uniref:DUF4283 domain-containing protein n=1 Tax=Senna tora TaxID=362788 RepID=A0A834WKI4_9FABA|nr:uncharacterized protein G2W53_022457 [Senna tora]